MQPMQPASKRHSNIPWIITIIFLVLLLFGAAGFGIWAYARSEDYKNNVEPKINAAVEIAKKQTETEKDNEFIEKEKNPYRTYISPSVSGSVKIIYPKTWSAYVDETGSVPVDGYFHPAFVPGLQSKKVFAIRVEVVNQEYSQVVRGFDGKAKSGKVKVAPYKAPKMPEVLGTRIDGEIDTGLKGSLVLLPLRKQTIKVSTQSSDQFAGDFNNIILANLEYEP